MGITSRLKVMSFLQYFIWGSWLVTLGSYMINTLDFTGANVGMVYSSKGLAAIIMPGIMGSLLINGCALSEPTCFAIWFARGRYCTPPPLPIPRRCSG